MYGYNPHDFDSDNESSVLDHVSAKFMNGPSRSPIPRIVVASDYLTKGTRMATKYPTPYVHYRPRFKRSSSEKEDVFHYFMKLFDKDYPIDPMRKANDKIPTCKKCGGLLWKRPSVTLSPSIMKRLALQIGMRLKMDQFSSSCDGELEDKAY